MITYSPVGKNMWTWLNGWEFYPLNYVQVMDVYWPVLFAVFLLLAGWVGFARRSRARGTRASSESDALIDSENRYKTLFENTIESIALHEMIFDERGDPVDYVFLDANPSFEQNTGLSITDIRGKKVSEVIPDISARMFIKRFGSVVQTGEPESLEEYSPVFKKYFQINAFPLGENRFAAAFIDITGRKEMEGRLRLSEERFRIMFENSPHGILVADVETQLFSYANPMICRMLKYSGDEIREMHLFDIHPRESWDLVKKEYADAHVRSRKVSRSIPFIRKDGSRFLGDVTAATAVIQGRRVAVGFISDVTETRNAEAERDRLLAEAESSRRILLSVLDDEKRGQIERARLVSAIEQAAEVVVVTDPQGIIQYVNPAFTKVSGYTREEALGQHTRMLKSGKQDETFYKNLWSTISSGGTWAGRLINRTRDGEYYTEDATISPVTDHHGNIINYVAVKRDITREIQVEQQLLQSQKMDVIGKLAGGVAHDFNNILQSILGFVDLASTEKDINVIRDDFLPEIRRAGESAAGLTRQLLAFSRRQVLEKKVVDINELIERMGKMMRRLIGEDISLSITMEPGIPSVWVDPGQTEQMLLNLIVNARDAMPDGGRLSISTCEAVFSHADLALHPDARPGTYVMISIADTGVGMNDEVKKRVFEPFFTTKPLGKGTGLGLATVFGIVKQHDGWISLYSEVGIGTDFHLYLPVHVDSNITASPEASPEVRQGQGERILIVEDEDAVRGLMAQLLKKYGYNVHLAANAEDALVVFREEMGRFDLICSDVVLPGRSGFDLVEELKRSAPDLKVLMVSGYTDERTRWPQIRQRGWRYLQKPIGLHKLMQTLYEMLQEADSPERDATE